MPSPMPSELRPPIAVVGLSCRFPGDATDPSRFWDMLKSGRDGYTPRTNRYNEDAFHHPGGNNKRQNVLPVKGGYLLKQDPYVWDAAFFNITAAEAIAFDPKQRIAMEVTYEALENAGMSLRKVAGTQTACYMGTSMSDYRDSIVRDFGNYPKYHLLGTSDEMISNRISHFLDIHGPSATIETACSSSHVATHLACQSLQSGESEMAIAGGVGMTLVPESTMQLNNLGFLSPLGQSRAFDSKAGGYARGEGCGVIIMKRLDKAIADGDTIRAIIRGSGVNQDGWTQGVTMPSGEAQASLIKYVYESNKLDYGATQYVEAHGPGTQAGDPTETGAIYRTIGLEGRKTNPSRKKLWVGSVKPNIGHLESAAGVAGLIKGILAMEHGFIPPNIHFDEPNPAIKLEEWGLAVPTKLMPWPACLTRRMSCSSFGMGGTNAHIVLEQPSQQLENDYAANGAIPPKHEHATRLFTFSSHDQAGFKRIGSAFDEHLDRLGPAASTPEYLANLSHTLAVARSGLSWKASCLADSAVELKRQLSTTLGDNATRGPGSQEPRIGFVFTGQGAQWYRMGVELMERKVFANSVAKSAELLRNLGADWDPLTELSKIQKSSRIGVPEISQPICSVLQIALVDLLRSWGITPSRVVGHSSGEIAAAYCIGALTHRDAMAAAYFRGEASAGLRGRKGGMMVVGSSPDGIKEHISDAGANVTVACVNSPLSITLSGDVDDLQTLQSLLEERGIFARRLKVDVAYHSTHMQDCSIEYHTSIQDLQGLQSEEDEPVVMISSVTGSEVDPEMLGPFYWVRNLISPVKFSDALKELVAPAGEGGDMDTAVDILVEVGPHSALAGPVKQTLAHHGIKNVAYASVLTREANAIETSMNLAAELFRLGVSVNVPEVNGDSHTHLLTDLPLYQWNHSEVFRADSRYQRQIVSQKLPARSILGAEQPSMSETERVWRGFIRLEEEPWLRDHTVGTTVLFPGAGVVSVVLEAAQQMAEDGKKPSSFTLRDISFTAMMPLTEDVATEIIVHIQNHLVGTTGSTRSSWFEFTVSSATGPTGTVRSNARGLLSINYEDSRGPQMVYEDALLEKTRIEDYQRILGECPDTCSKEKFYETLTRSGLEYGDVFRGVATSHPGNGKTAFDIQMTDIGETFTKGRLARPFLIHGAALDAILQAWMGSTSGSNGPGSFGFDKPMLPKSIGELEISADIPADIGYIMPGYSRSTRHGFHEWSADVATFDTEMSRVFLTITDFRLAELEVDDAAKPALELEEEGFNIDPAEIASDIRWNYDLELMKPSEVAEVISKASATTRYSRLMELVLMSIHSRPAVNVIELAADSKRLHDAVMSKLPKGTINRTQIRYALANTTDTQDADGIDDDILAQSFPLGPLDITLAADTDSADLIVIPYHAIEELKADTDSIMERLISLAKPDSTVLLVGRNAPSVGGTNLTSMLADKGFELSTSIPVGVDSLTLQQFINKKSPQPERLVNGATGKKAVILTRPTPSTTTKDFALKLEDLLNDIGFSASTESNIGAELDASATYVSLLELEEPMLEDLSEAEFNSVRNLMLNSDRLLWITQGANPAFGVVDGLARVIRSEYINARIQVLHLMSLGTDVGPASASRILLSPTDDSEFMETGGLLKVSRIYRSPNEDNHIRDHLFDSTRVISLPTDQHAPALKLAVGKPGLLNTLHFVPDDNMESTSLADDEVELQVMASGINFRDIMGSMGLLPVSGLGQEASGVVIRAGKLCTANLKPGDPVSTLTVGGTHATKIRCHYRVAHKIPENLSFEEAAGIPVVHCTAYYALVKLARLRRGQSILVHAAAGGTGQAAVQLAKHLGLTVYATVGTDEKRELLTTEYGIPEEHIFNSRDISFVKGIKRITNGRGVDCVLNSLSGELLRQSFGCLATFGKFVEIGLRDITDNMRLDMRPFQKSTTFSFINMVTFLQENPDAMGDILKDVFSLVSKGILKPAYPVTIYPVGKVEDAFRVMQQGKHLGKMVLSYTQGGGKAPVLCKAKDSLKLDPAASYLIIGGLGGLGRSLATAFVACGARNIAFMARSGDSKPEAKTTVDQLVACGANVKVYRADVSVEASFTTAMKQCSEEMPPIKGVIQMAMVLRDVVFEKMKYEEWTTGLRPKVQGTWNIHQYFDSNRPLDFMILCSSTAGVFGNPSQAQYAAGNTFQDTLANWRRHQGLKAVSVNLGIMRDVGVIAEGTSNSFASWEKVLGIREPAFHALMKSLINGQQDGARSEACPAQVIVGLGTGEILASNNIKKPAYFDEPRFGPLAFTGALSNTAPGARDGSTVSLSSKLMTASAQNDSAGASSIVKDALIKKVADILRIPSSEVDASRPMYRYGVDSLVALEVRNWISKEMKANLSLLEILAATPIEAFAVQIAKKSRLLEGMSF